MVYSLRLKLQILSALSVLLLDKPLLFVTSHLFEEGKKKVCSTFLLVEMNYHVVSSTNSFSHTFLRACLPPHLGHKCLPPVTLIKTPWPWDKFLLFHMLLLWFGLFLWVCKDENSLHRACKPSNEKGETQRKNIFRKRGENHYGPASDASVPHMSSRTVLILGALKEALGCQDASGSSALSLDIQYA